MARTFKPDEVTFTVTATPDEVSLTDFDEQTTRMIDEEVERGNVWAWANVTVSASWSGFTGNAHLGGCSYKDEEDFRVNGAYLKDMLLEAVNDLVEQITKAGWSLDCSLEDIKKAVAKENAA